MVAGSIVEAKRVDCQQTLLPNDMMVSDCAVHFYGKTPDGHVVSFAVAVRVRGIDIDQAIESARFKLQDQYEKRDRATVLFFDMLEKELTL